MLHDLRYALRTLRASPGFTAVAVISMGLALGLGTTMYALADAVLRPYIPFEAAGELYHVHAYGGDRARGPTRYEQFLRLRASDTFRDRVSAWSERVVTARGPSGTRELTAAHVSANLFRVLGVMASDGTGFLSTDGLSADESTAVVSERAWRRLTGETRLTHGAHLTIDGVTFSVVGIMPAGMSYPQGTDVWIPFAARSLRTGDGIGVPGLLLRIPGDHSVKRTQQELDVIGARLSTEYSLTTHPVYYRLEPLRPRFSRLRPVHMALGLAGGVVLLIACANLSTLILVRTLARARELAVRAAIGATPGALLRVVLGEAALIAAAGAVTGMLVAIWAIDVAGAIIPSNVERLGLLAPRLTWRVFAFGAVSAVVAVLVASLAPAFAAARSAPDGALKHGSGSHTRRLRLRYNPLVIGTLALSLVLTMASALLVRSSAELHRFTFGYDLSGLKLGVLHAPPGATQVEAGVATFYEELLDRARTVEGVRDAALFGTRAPERQTITIDDPGAGSRERFHRAYRIVDAAFLSTLRIPVLEGRDFDEGDEVLANVAIVDERMARELWPNAPAIGRVVKLGRERSSARWVRIVGIARSAYIEAAPGEFPQPEMYVLRPRGDDTRYMRLAIRATRESPAIDTRLMRAMNSLAPNAMVAAQVMPWTNDLDALARRTHFLTMLLVTFAGFGVLIAIVGLYGVLAYTVQQRMRELAVRVALGASRRDLARLVMHDSAVMVLGGIGIGAFLALWAVRGLRFVVFGLDTYDPVALLAGEAALVLVAAIACLAPLSTATRADPRQVLRSF